MDHPIVPQTVPDPQVPPDANRSAIWGPVVTLLWSVSIAIVFLLAQGFTLVVYLLWLKPDLHREAAEVVIRNLRYDGLFQSLCTFATLLVCVPLIIGIVKLKRGSKLQDYLGLRSPPLKEALRWSLITLSYCLLAQTVSFLWKPEVPEFIVEVYSSPCPRWVLWPAIIIAAPIFEEICFRGFIFKGLSASRLHWYGATLVTAALWAGIHQQYDWFWMTFVFLNGLILGTARAKTDSTLLTIWLHTLVNAVATAQIEFALLQT